MGDWKPAFGSDRDFLGCILLGLLAAVPIFLILLALSGFSSA